MGQSVSTLDNAIMSAFDKCLSTRAAKGQAKAQARSAADLGGVKGDGQPGCHITKVKQGNKGLAPIFGIPMVLGNGLVIKGLTVDNQDSPSGKVVVPHTLFQVDELIHHTGNKEDCRCTDVEKWADHFCKKMCAKAPPLLPTPRPARIFRPSLRDALRPHTHIDALHTARAPRSDTAVGKRPRRRAALAEGSTCWRSRWAASSATRLPSLPTGSARRST